MNKLNTLYHLPNDVVFCKKCVMSNQRPASIPEFKHNKNRDGAKYMQIDKKGICDACKQAEAKESIDWESREKELIALCDKYRKNDGNYDCLVP